MQSLFPCQSLVFLTKWYTINVKFSLTGDHGECWACYGSALTFLESRCWKTDDFEGGTCDAGKLFFFFFREVGNIERKQRQLRQGRLNGLFRVCDDTMSLLPLFMNRNLICPDVLCCWFEGVYK